MTTSLTLPRKSTSLSERSAYDWSLITSEALAAVPVAIEDGMDCRKIGLTLIEQCSGETVSATQLENLRFIASVLLMGLNPENHKAPLKPGICYATGVPSLEQVYPKAELRPLIPWAASLPHPELRARFMDLAWMVCRDIQAAMEAISAYVQAAAYFESKSQWAFCAIRLERALRLAVSLGKGGHHLTTDVLTAIHDTLNRQRGSATGLLVNPLVAVALEFSKSELESLAGYAECAANCAASQGENWHAHASQRLAAKCYRKAGLSRQARVAEQKGAESLVAEAYAMRRRPGGGNIAACSVLEQAISELRQGGPDSRADMLFAELLQWQASIRLQVETHQVLVEGKELVSAALEAIHERPLKEALLALCALTNTPSIEYLKTQAHTSARAAPITNLFGKKKVSPEGKTIAWIPPLTEDMKDPSQHDALRSQMYFHARLWRGLVVQAQINPACQSIYKQDFNAAEFIALVSDSPWIPPGHHQAICRALLAGFQRDTVLVAHLVPPQLEAMIRHVVALQGGPAFVLEANGAQSANTMGPLLSTPEALSAFSEDGIFELKDLLTDALGTNLRNNVAHGLLTDAQLSSDPDVYYAWWVLLRLCLKTSRSKVLPVACYKNASYSP